MKIKAETRIEINVRDHEMYVNYGTCETESEYHGLEDYLRINLNLKFSIYVMQTMKQNRINFVTYRFRSFC